MYRKDHAQSLDLIVINYLLIIIINNIYYLDRIWLTLIQKLSVLGMKQIYLNPNSFKNNVYILNHANVELVFTLQ